MATTFTPSKEDAWILLSFLWSKTQDEKDSKKTIWDVVYPVTQRPFSESDATKLVDLLSGSIQKDFKEMKKQEVTDDETGYRKAQVPMYEANVVDGDDEQTQKNQEALRIKFQGIVRRFLKTENKPANQLAFLNKIQQKTKFNLFDLHKGKRSSGSSTLNSLKYGYADLLRFLCEPVKSGEVARLTKANPIGSRYVVDNENGHYIKNYNGSYTKLDEYSTKLTDAKVRYSKEATTNPFYNPIQYDVPDERGNELLENLYVGARQYYAKKMSELNYLKKELTAKPSRERRKSILENMLLIFRQIHDNRFDPIHLSKQIRGQERPMETYKNEHFYELLEQLATRKALAPASLRQKPPSGNTGIEIVMPNRLGQRATRASHKKTRSSSPKHLNKVRHL